MSSPAAGFFDDSESALAALAEVTREPRAGCYYARVTQWYRKLVGASHVGLLLLDENDRALFVADTGLSKEYKRAVEGHFPWRRDEVDAGAFGVANVFEDAPLAEYRDLFQREEIAALSFVPIRGETQLVGKLMAYYDKPRAFDAAELGRIQNFAEHIAFAIEAIYSRAAAKREAVLHDILLCCTRPRSAESMARASLDAVLLHPGLGGDCQAVLYLWDSSVGRLSPIAARSITVATADESSTEWERRCVEVMQVGEADFGGMADGAGSPWKIDKPLGAEKQILLPLKCDGEPKGILALFPASVSDLVFLDKKNLQTISEVVASALHALHLQGLLRDQEQSFRALLDYAPITAAIHRKGRFVYVNQSMADSLGYESAEALEDVSLGEIIHPDDRALLLERNISMLETGRAAPPALERFLHRNGSTVFAEAVAVPVAFGGQPSIFVLARDVSEERALQAQSALQNRLAALGQLAAMVGHDINNPLTYITANLRFALDCLHDEDCDAREALDDAAHGAELIAQITEDLRSYARVSEDGEEVRLGDIVGFVTRMASASFRDEAPLSVDVDADLSVVGVPARVTQILMNLVRNAVQACSAARGQGVVSVRGHRRGEVAVLEVEDSGVGMSAQQICSAFEPFVTGKAEGTGLGLYITKSLVVGMGGTIEIRSELGEGTTVYLTLPLSNQESSTPVSESHENTAADPVGSPSPLRLVLIDDEVHALRGMKRQLRSQYDVVIMHGGENGLHYLREHGDCVDLVLCDIMMPQLSGPELFQALQREGKGSLLKRFCFMTGGVYTKEALAFLELERVPVLFKPLDSEEFAVVAKQIFEGAGRSGGTSPPPDGGANLDL